MHKEAAQWVGRFASPDPLRVLDIGGRDINGSAMEHFPNADKTVLDIAPGPGVDVVADAATWIPDREYDMVIAAEVFEHTASWPEICKTAFAALRPGGEFVVTCAGPGRAPHSGHDGRGVRPGEYYGNVDPAYLGIALRLAGFANLLIDQAGEDVRAHAVKPTKET